ncbi:hypothetical protein KR009_002227, partial [Drosophila setifemur]
FNKCLRFLRYTRADLLAVRYEDRSRLRPQCAKRPELQTLHFWKININPTPLNVTSSYTTQNKNSLSPEADNSTLNSTSVSISSRRALRNRERANNYYQRFVPTDSHLNCVEEKDKELTNIIQGQSYKSLIIDHRSISSSHLMPAFAKRRFAAVNGGSSSENNEPVQNTCDDGVPILGLIDRTCTPTQTRSDYKGNATSSPVWKSSEFNNSERRLNYVQPDNEQSLTTSPTFLTTRQERRIGSGRLLPRSENWDYKGQKATESSIDREKDTPLSASSQHNQNQPRQRTISGRLSDRTTEQADRRFQYEKRSSDRHNASNRRVPSKDSGNNQNRGKRSNTYHTHDKNEEPEWFSAGPTSQLETIDLHGFDDVESDNVSSELEDRNTKCLPNECLADGQIAHSSSRRSSNVSLNLNDDSLCSGITDSGVNIMAFIQTSSELNHHNKHQSRQLTVTENSESEFNFDAFLNMHPLDNTNMNNDGIEKSETKGTSRFSRWFRHKEIANNNETSGFLEPHVQTKLGIPTVKDLEAQMTKVDMRAEYMCQMTLPFSQLVHGEKPVARDTEAFKKLLQQLGSQNRQPQPSNDIHHIMKPLNSGSLDELGSYQQRIKQKDCTPQTPTHNIQVPNVIPSSGHVLTQKRIEIQHLIQSLISGDVSLEFLEKELSNPATPPLTREVISTVLRDYAQTRRNPLIGHQMIPNPSFLQSQTLQHPIEEFFPQNSANHGINQHISHSNSPTPLAFTPTSVLRKMTAEKDTTPTQSVAHSQHLQYQMQNQAIHANVNETQGSQTTSVQPRMILGGGNYTNSSNVQEMSPNLSQCRNQPLIKWNAGTMQMVHGKTFGRPILKGGLNSIPQQSPSPSFTSKIELQQVNHHQHHMLQQQHPIRLKSTQPVESIFNTENVHQTMPFSEGISPMQHPIYLQHQQQHGRQPLRHRVIHGELHRQSNMQISSPIPGYPDSSDCGTKNNSLGSNNYHRDDRLPSPTNNQLAQWFSPELLARASAGKLPLLNMNQALSLEEFERSMQHSSAVVHN